MADNHLYLTCPGCGEAFMLARHLGEAWYTPVGRTETAESFASGLDAFFEKHWHCDYDHNLQLQTDKIKEAI